MYEKVEVVRKNKSKNTVDVSCPTDACENCSGTMFCNVKGKTFEATINKEHDDIKVGDMAELYLPPNRTIFSTFMTLMVPLLCFPLFYMIFNVKNEGLHFLTGILGIVVGFLLVNLYFKKAKGKFVPTISRIFKDNE
jgi:positive regulator of sigma E activity